MAGFVSFGEEKISEKGSFSALGSGEWGILCIKQGSGIASLNGISYQMEESSVCIVSKKDSFSFVPEMESELLYVSFDEVSFASSRLLPLLEIFYLKNRVRKVSDENRKILLLFDEMRDIPTENPFCSHLLYSKLVELLCLLGIAFEDEKEKTSHEKISSAVIRYINENLENSFTLDDIAKSLFVSKYYMSHIFKKEVGVSVGEMVLIKKMDYADHLLSMGITAHRVSELTGFRSYSAFYRIYKRIKGRSPQGKGN